MHKYNVCVLSSRAKILYLPGLYTNDAKTKYAELLFQRIKGKAIVMLHTTSCAEDNDHYTNWLTKYSLLYPDLHFVLLVNDYFEYVRNSGKGFDCHLVNQNIFLDENIYKPLAKVEKLFDWVYNAQFIKVKRHQLLSGMRNGCLIGYNYEEPYYTDVVEPLLETANTLANEIVDGKLKFIDAKKINAIYNSSRIGLCLSAREGAMYSALEYQLAGVPVITTLNKGGRDYFSDPRYYFHINDGDLLHYSNDLCKVDFSSYRYEIRDAVLYRLIQGRKGFIRLLERISSQYFSVSICGEEEWDRFFCNKLVKSYDIEDLMREFEYV